MSDEDFNHWDQIAEKFSRAIGQVVRKSAMDIQAKAQETVVVDTGFLKNSIYTVTYNSKGTKTIIDKATGQKRTISKPIRSTRRRVKKSQQDMVFPELSVSLDDQTAYVAVGAVYGLYVELGARGRPARPYFLPAIDAVRPSFDAALSKIEEKLDQDLGGSIDEE